MRIFILFSIEKLIEFVTHLSGEDQQRAFPALVKNALAVSLEKLVERGRRKLPLGGFQNATRRDFSIRKIPA